MIYYSYAPQQDFTTLGHRKEEICRYLKEKGVSSYSELKAKFNPRTLGKHLKELEKKEIIKKTESGKYQLTKEVRVERSRHLYKQFTFDGTAQNNYIEYYNIEELPEHLKNSLLISPSIRLDFVKNPHLPIQIQEKIFRHLFQ